VVELDGHTPTLAELSLAGSGGPWSPPDGAGLAAAVTALLTDWARARAIGARAHDRVRDYYLAPRQLTATMDLVCELT
jgi:hypothetical protein